MECFPILCCSGCRTCRVCALESSNYGIVIELTLEEVTSTLSVFIVGPSGLQSGGDFVMIVVLCAGHLTVTANVRFRIDQ